MSHCASPVSPSFAGNTMERRYDAYPPPRFIEPRQLTLNPDDRDDPEGGRPPMYEDPAAFPLDPALRTEGSPPPHGYAPHDGYSPGFVEHERRMGFGGPGVGPGGEGPFLWGGDYAPPMGEPHDMPRMPYEDWVDPILHGRPEMGYEHLPFPPPMGFPGPFPSMDDAFAHQNHYSPFPMAPPPGFPHFMYGPGPGEGGPPFGNPFPPPMPHGHPGHMPPPNNLPLLPSLSSLNLANLSANAESEPNSAAPSQAPEKTASTSTRKPRIDRRNSKPLTVDDLAHDNSRFAKVVKAFLSIAEPEQRTVPEIAKRVSDMYAGQYADFEGVKRMVNDVLQKHKAFWHPGRGSPYQLSLMEGRARREFPSNNKHHVKGAFDENMFYPGRSERRKQKKNQPRSMRGTEMTPEQDTPDSMDPKVLQLGVVDAIESAPHADPSMIEREYMNIPMMAPAEADMRPEVDATPT